MTWLVELAKLDSVVAVIAVCAIYYTFKWILQCINTALGGGKFE